MRKKEGNKKSSFHRKQQSESEDEFRIIRDDELFGNAADSYDDDDDYPDEEDSEDESGEDSEHGGILDDAETEESEDMDGSDGIAKEDDNTLAVADGVQGPEEPESNEESDEDAEEEDELESDESEPDEDYEEYEEYDMEETDMDEEEEDEKREPTEAEKALKRHRKRKRILLAVLSVFGVIAASYLGVSAFFNSHFYYNTKINGVDFSLKTVEEVEEYMEGEVAGYSLTLSELTGKEEVIYGTDISLKYVNDNSIDKLLEQQSPFLWFTALWKEPEIEAPVGVVYDEEQLKEAIGKLECMKPEEQTPPVSAKPEFQGTQFEIKKEEFGTQVDNEKFMAVVSEAISEFQPAVNMEEKNCYVAPVFTSESPEVIAAKDAMNNYLRANITLDFTPYTEVVDATVISQWISVDDAMQVNFNQEAVRGFIAGLAENYDTYGRPRSFTTGFGNTVQVEGGSYGWLIDQEAEYNALTANIQNGETITREPNYARRGATHEGNDFGNTYAEVDLTNQHMFFFKDGQCIMQSDIVTGNPNQGHATPQGVYTLAYKTVDQVLRGRLMEDGSYEYESPVSYWMPFNGGIGFHDATWQSAFGGSRYLAYGSHGCVNMPIDAAAELYSYVEAGMPVVCHY